MTIFLASVTTVIVVSCFCSLSEASIYAVRRPYIRTLSDTGSLAGRILDGFKQNMEQPISAILIVNTVANTAGASVAGAQARALFGPNALIWFSIAFTLAVLFISEIIPKIMGVVYSRPVARAVALPWYGAVRLLAPVVWAVQKVSHWLKPNEPVMAAPEEEVRQLSRLSAEEGSILAIEATLVSNVLKLNEVTAGEIMTPRTVVFRLPDNMTLGEVAESVDEWHYSRIPVHAAGEAERWTGWVRTQDILSGLADDLFDMPLDDLSRPITFVTLGTPGHRLLGEMIERRTHLVGVADDFGGVAGVVTLEDVIEALIGTEIVDEFDAAVDLQELARERHRARMEERGLRHPPADSPGNA